MRHNFTEQDLENMPPGFEQFVDAVVKECGIYADMYNFERAQGSINPYKTSAYEFICQHFGIEAKDCD